MNLRRNNPLTARALHSAVQGREQTKAARLTPAQRVALAKRTQRLTPANDEQTDSTELIRQDRNTR